MAGEFCLESPGLQSFEFTGGETVTLSFELVTKSGAPYNAEDDDVNFALTDYVNRSDEPIISRPCTISVGPEGIANIATIVFDPQETLNLHGKFVYQITVRNGIDGEYEVPGHGLSLCARNTDRQFIS
jgi:hypothetical protein